MSGNSSGARPIHQLSREIRSTPDESEPSYSYEQESFLAQKEDVVADQYHQKHMSRRDSTGSHGSNNNLYGKEPSNGKCKPSSASAAAAATNGSFWRMEALQQQQQGAGQSPQLKSAVMGSPLQSARGARSVGSNKTKKGGSMLGAALNAGSSAGSVISDTPSWNEGSISSRGNGRHVSAPTPQPQQQQRLSKKKKDTSKQRSAERRNKHEAQNEHDLGHMMMSSSMPSHHTQSAMTTTDLRGHSETLPEHEAYHHNPRHQSEGGAPHHHAAANHNGANRAVSHGMASAVGEADTGSAPFGWTADTSGSLSVADVSTTDTVATAATGRSAETAGSSLLFGKPSNGSVLLGKSSSLIFPTGVEPSTATGRGTSIGSVGRGSSNASSSDYAANNLKRRKVNLLLDQCETVRFPFKKKLILNDLSLTAADIPVKDLCGTPLGSSLHKLSLAGNRLGYIPGKLVINLPVLKHLDLSQCELHHLPETWYLPNLRRLNLSHNRLTDFPEESMLEGLPELQELNMYGNKVAEIIIPHHNGSNKKQVLSKLETLNLGYNDLSYLPDDLDLLKSLRTLKVMNNFLEKVPMRVCDMDLRMIDVSSNPVIQPPIETCERGISSMKRYYHCLRMEENYAATTSKSSSYIEDLKKEVKKTKKKVSYNLLKAPKLLMPTVQRSPSSATSTSHPPTATRQVSDEASMSQSSVATAPTGVTHAAQSANLASSVTSSPTPSEDRKMPAVASRSKSDGDYRANPVVSPPPNVSKVVEIDDGGPVSAQRASYSLADSAESSVDTPSLPQHVDQLPPPESITVNDTLKVIFVGMAMVGKTSMIKRLIEGENAIIPSHDDRTVGVDIYEWDNRKDKRFEHIDSRIQFEDKELEQSICKAAGLEQHNVNVKFSVWDFAGQHVYHATHQLFFSPRALYILVWDMGATNRGTLRRKNSRADERGAFKLSYDSSDEEDSEEDEEFDVESEARRADRALDRDIDEKVQFWVDCIQSSAPGAAILPVASFNDHFTEKEGDVEEAKRRCRVMKNRLLRHEERRIEGIKQRLKEYHDSNRANDEGAVRLQKLLDSYTRPKLIFWGDDDPVVRVSGSVYTGFDVLTEKIVNIATGRYKGQWQHPIFRGHIGARIPRMRLEVREAVRTLRNRFKVVEWGYFLNQLKDRGLTSVEDISDALHFLTNVGELSYFGAVYTDKQTKMNIRKEERRRAARAAYRSNVSDDSDDDDLIDDDDFDDDYDEGGALLSLDDTTMSASAQITEESSLTNSAADWNVNGLSQFVFLNPRWLVAAVACILRHDLDREIQETRRSLSANERNANAVTSFYDAHLNCPVITAQDAKMLWQAKKITKKAADRALKSSSNMSVTPFEFLLLLLIRFGVFVPIDLSIEKAFLGGKDYAGQETEVSGGALPSEVSISDTTTTAATTDAGDSDSALQAKFFFLPSLLGPGEPAEAWTYKNSESWKITLAHSVLFPDGVPPGLMERITASVLSNVYATAHKTQQNPNPKGRLSVKEVLCWRTAFYLKLGTQSSDNKESIVEIFTHLVDRDSNLCVGSDYMGIGMRRLITSAKGQVGDRGRKIWEGGYLLVVQSVRQVMDEYGGLEFERQAFCTDCLAKSALSRTSAWDFTVLRSAVINGDGTLRCRDGHRVDTSLIAGPSNEPKRANRDKQQQDEDVKDENNLNPVVPVKDLLRGVVVVGLFDGKTKKVVRVGSGFVADKKRGLIVTASHTLMNIWGDKNTPFGENYYGLRQGKVVIGVIPRQKETNSAADSTMALFRYFAVIVAKDPSIDRGECHLDACVLRITTRMENDVGGDGDGCGDQPERLLLNNPDALKKEKLQPLKITEKVELDEQVRILGYNQGGEGLLGPGQSLNRYVDFARGYVCKMFSGDMSEEEYQRHRFKPRKEIVVICPTIGGHSGGPCVNQQGEVIGILSRADPAESQRCYLVPTYEWKSLVKQAKNMI